MKMLMMTMIAVMLATPVQAAEESCDVNVKVNGLVCDFCARALEKVFSRKDEVEAIKVDLNTGSVLVTMKPDRDVSDEELTKLITDSGYNVTAIERGCS